MGDHVGEPPSPLARDQPPVVEEPHPGQVVAGEVLARDHAAEAAPVVDPLDRLLRGPAGEARDADPFAGDAGAADPDGGLGVPAEAGERGPDVVGGREEARLGDRQPRAVPDLVARPLRVREVERAGRRKEGPHGERVPVLRDDADLERVRGQEQVDPVAPDQVREGEDVGGRVRRARDHDPLVGEGEEHEPTRRVGAEDEGLRRHREQGSAEVDGAGTAGSRHEDPKRLHVRTVAAPAARQEGRPRPRIDRARGGDHARISD